MAECTTVNISKNTENKRKIRLKSVACISDDVVHSKVIIALQSIMHISYIGVTKYYTQLGLPRHNDNESAQHYYYIDELPHVEVQIYHKSMTKMRRGG
ncbi:hypothetical protein GCM10009129_13270 [Psychrobacter aestuarii]|uniref:Uncharacterized protein n=1 Tax=Psychrobacter aestuarii TaxID=556327 RepID=A0ABP3FGC2_9GAMM